MPARPSGKAPRKPYVWLFDLDNTLHHASHAVFGEINRLMTDYVAKTLSVDHATASAVRMDYWHRYGATVLGMAKHHGVRPADFLAAAHDFPDLPSLLRAERGIARMLRAIPGRKFLLTNAPQAYSTQVVRHLKLHHSIEQHIAVEDMHVHGRLRPKPDRLMMRRVLAKYRIPAHRVILVEDTESHLKSYRSLGLRTVWVTGFLPPALQRFVKRRPSYVDLKVQSISQLARSPFCATKQK